MAVDKSTEVTNKLFKHAPFAPVVDQGMLDSYKTAMSHASSPVIQNSNDVMRFAPKFESIAEKPHDRVNPTEISTTAGQRTSGVESASHSKDKESHSDSSRKSDVAKHDTPKHDSHKHDSHGHDSSKVAHSEKPMSKGDQAVADAIGNHMKKHGMGAEVKPHLEPLAKGVSDFIADGQHKGGTLTLHKHGKDMASIDQAGSAPVHHKGDLPSIKMETLAYIKEHGMPTTGLGLARAALGKEVRGMSDIDLMQKMGPATLEHLGNNGINLTKLDAVHNHIKESVAGTGFEHSTSRLDSLRAMADMGPGDRNFVMMDKEKGVAGVMSLAEAQKHNQEHSNRTVAAIDITGVKQELGMATEPSKLTIETISNGSTSAREVPVEERSVIAQAKQLAPVEERSVVAEPKHLAPVEERSVVAEPKHLAPVEDRSVIAQPRQQAPVEERSFGEKPQQIAQVDRGREM